MEFESIGVSDASNAFGSVDLRPVGAMNESGRRLALRVGVSRSCLQRGVVPLRLDVSTSKHTTQKHCCYFIACCYRATEALAYTSP